MNGRTIHRLAIVNRGEAAMRCIRAVKALAAEGGRDIQVIALFTEVDRDAPFVRHADFAVRLASPNGAVAAYLDHDNIIAALREARADAVWPGWGFVAEDPKRDFCSKHAASSPGTNNHDINFVGTCHDLPTTGRFDMFHIGYV